jgi:sugar phosphate isomerase/epimerase
MKAKEIAAKILEGNPSHLEVKERVKVAFETLRRDNAAKIAALVSGEGASIPEKLNARCLRQWKETAERWEGVINRVQGAFPDSDYMRQWFGFWAAAVHVECMVRLPDFANLWRAESSPNINWSRAERFVAEVPELMEERKVKVEEFNASLTERYIKETSQELNMPENEVRDMLQQNILRGHNPLTPYLLKA